MPIEHFQKVTRTERSALEYLRKNCLTVSELYCPKCGSEKVYIIQDNRYKCPICRYSFRDGSSRWFGLLRLRPTQLLWLLKLFELEATALVCAKQLNLSYPTAAKAFHIVRRAIFVANGDGVFTGCRVEVDEAYFGGRKRGRRGRGADGKVPVFGMKCREGKARMEIVSDVSSNSLIGIITKHFDKGTLIYSDSFKSYHDLRVKGYRRKVINHKYGFANGSTHTNGVEGLWSYVKEGLAKHHGVSQTKLPFYVKEQEWRFNNRGKDLFELLVRIMCNFVPRS
jgi:transposase